MLIKNVEILPMTEKDKVIHNASILIKGSKIEKIITDGSIPEDNDVIDGKGMIALPGFINTHTHSAMTFLRNYANDMNLQDWLFKKIFPAEDKLSAETTYWFSRLAEIEYIKSGITTHVDNYFFMDEEARAIKESGARGVLARSVSGCSDPDFKKLKESIDFYNKFNNTADGRIMCTLSQHAIYTSDEAYLKKAFDAARELGSGTQIHVAETKKEVEDCIKEHGETPVEYINRLGGFDCDGTKIAAHCVYVSESDKAILKEKNVSVAINMSSNLKLASGIPDVPGLVASGLNVTLGTDGPSSNNNLSMFNEMRLTSLVTKGIRLDPLLMTAEEVLKLATANGARAIGRNDLGTIEEGKSADIILLDADMASSVPTNGMFSAVVYSMSSENVKTVICNGKVIMKDRTVCNIDEKEAIERVKHYSAQLLM